MRTPHERLAELAWLVGHWEETDEVADLSVHSEYSWARGGNFLTRNVTVKRAGETTLESWQIIGWDSVEERIRSWTFDGEGGFAAGWWTREGDRWLLRETGITPDGSRHDAWNQRADQHCQRHCAYTYGNLDNHQTPPPLSGIRSSTRRLIGGHRRTRGRRAT